MSTAPQDELANPLEPSSTHTCEHSKARKTGAQLRDNRRSGKNEAKCVKNPSSLPLLKVEHLSLLRAGRSTKFAMT